MKKILSIVVLMIFLTGCGNNQKANVTVNSNDANQAQIKVVEKYNQSIFTKDWANAQKLLAGQAYKAYEINISKYKNSSNLIKQTNSLESVCDKFSIVHSDIYLETFNDSSKSVLSRKSVRYFLYKYTDWKIIKVEESDEQYSKQFGNSINSQEQVKIKQLISDYINYSAQGKYDKASVYLTGNLIGDAEKYKIDNLPKYKISKLSIEIIGSTLDEVITSANYSVNNKDIKMVFHIVKIKGIWLIDEQIIG